MSRSNDLRILIIDDNKAIHQDFIKILTADHQKTTIDDLDKILYEEEKNVHENALYLPKFQIDSALQGQEGLKCIEKSLKENRPYALVFVDIRMPPGWDGIETIKRIWAISPATQVVICTAYSDCSWEETVIEFEITDKLLVLKKPFDNQVVRQLSCALTKKWQLEQVTKKHTKALDKMIQIQTSYLKKCFSLVRLTLKSSIDGILMVSG